MALLTVAGVAFPAPNEMTVEIDDILKADRNTAGTMIAERITTKRKLNVSYSYLSAAQTALVLSTIQNSLFFSVTYTDPLTNASSTRTFYAGDRTCGVMDFFGGIPRYKDVKFNFIER